MHQYCLWHAAVHVGIYVPCGLLYAPRCSSPGPALIDSFSREGALVNPRDEADCACVKQNHQQAFELLILHGTLHTYLQAAASSCSKHIYKLLHRPALSICTNTKGARLQSTCKHIPAAAPAHKHNREGGRGLRCSPPA